MTDRYRILITGSRTFVDECAIRQALGEYVALRGPENVVIIHGACPRGADAIADQIGTDWTGLTVERHPANWWPGGHFNRRAGFERNAHMVDLGADICLAFIAPCTNARCRKPRPHGSHGATDCADKADRAGIPVRRWQV